MKIRVAFTVNLDAEAWANEYYLEKDEVRADFIVWARSQVVEELADRGMLIR